MTSNPACDAHRTHQVTLCAPIATLAHWWPWCLVDALTPSHVSVHGERGCFRPVCLGLPSPSPGRRARFLLLLLLDTLLLLAAVLRMPARIVVVAIVGARAHTHAPALPRLRRGRWARHRCHHDTLAVRLGGCGGTKAKLFCASRALLGVLPTSRSASAASDCEFGGSRSSPIPLRFAKIDPKRTKLAKAPSRH